MFIYLCDYMIRNCICTRSQFTATHCNTLQRTATHCNTLQHTATRCNTLENTLYIHTHSYRHVHTWYAIAFASRIALQRTATHLKTLYTYTLQRTTTYCNTLQHAATHLKTLYTCTPIYRHMWTHDTQMCLHIATHCNALPHISAHCNTLPTNFKTMQT